MTSTISDLPTRKIEMEIHEKSNKQFSETNTNPNTNISIMDATNTIIAPVNVAVAIAIAAPVKSNTSALPAPPAPPKTECVICCEKYNRSTHVPITCQACGFPVERRSPSSGRTA